MAYLIKAPHPRIAVVSALAGACLLLGACFNPDDPPADDDVGTDTGTTDTTGDGDTTTTDDTTTTGDDTTTDTSTDTSTDGPCSELGCQCDGSPESCDEGLYCFEGACVAGECGNMMVEGPEQCDDGNEVDGDGCDADCSFTEIVYVDASYQNTCALLEGGRVRCWGENGAGQLGYGHTDDIGDDETPAEVGDVMLPEPGVELTMGDSHSCILMADMAVRCWGNGSGGKLGYGSTENIGDDEFPNSITDVPIGGAALEVDAGGGHTCARLDDGKLRCWGNGSSGALGYGNTNSIGDNEPPANAGDVPVGGAVVAQATGISHTCAIIANGAIRCWGSGFSGRLGYGDTENVGDNETPQSKGNVPAVPMGLDPTTKATALALGLSHSCALYETGDVLCWGAGFNGQLGQGTPDNIGDDEFPATLPAVQLPSAAVAISVGDNHSCALLDTEEAICWGSNNAGQLGYGNTDNVGDDETPMDVGVLDLGGPVKQIDAGGNHTCAIMAGTNELLCWGLGISGQLGYANVENIGDDELPADAGPVSMF